MLLAIMPYADASIYNRVKFAYDVKAGLHNICVVSSKFAKDRNDQYFANVALKFNVKLGGRNQFLDNNKLGIIHEGKTMVVGIDVTHPSSGLASNGPSVAGIVASKTSSSRNGRRTYRSRPLDRRGASLAGMLKSRLHLWAKNNKGTYLKNILIYRDGVFEGQYDIVLDQELPLLPKACKVYPAGDTKKGLPRMSISSSANATIPGFT
jgi:eukaryotic translation initiation factor 2C